MPCCSHVAHNSIIKESENSVKICKMQHNLVWQTLSDSNSKAYVPPSLKSYMNRKFEIRLQDDTHKLDRAGEQRSFKYEGYLKCIGKRGVVIDKIFAYLFGNVLILGRNSAMSKQ